LAFGGDARVREFALTLEVLYEVRDAAGESLLDVQEVRVSRSYEFDEQAILAASREQDNLAVVLRQIAVERVLNGLSAINPAL
jgi:outer membrane lipopolysaccharide assembly protein LptE/RlpB